MKSRGYKFTLLAACLLASSAFATGQHGKSHAENTQAPPPANQGPTHNNGNGQGQQQSSANTNVVNSNASSKAKGGNAVQGQKQNMRNAGNSNVVIGGSSYQEAKRPVNTAYAAGLVASPGTCLGSASGGVQGSAIGLSFGSTTRDDGCHLIRRMVVLDQLGMSDAALSLACLEDDNIREAMTRVGRSCATGRVSTSWNVQSANPVVPVLATVYRPVQADRN